MEASPYTFLLFLGHRVPCCLLEAWKVASSTLGVLCSQHVMNTTSCSVILAPGCSSVPQLPLLSSPPVAWRHHSCGHFMSPPATPSTPLLKNPALLWPPWSLCWVKSPAFSLPQPLPSFLICLRCHGPFPRNNPFCKMPAHLDSFLLCLLKNLKQVEVITSSPALPPTSSPLSHLTMAWEDLQPLLSPILSHFTAGQLRSPKNCPVCLSPRSSRLLLIPVHWWSFWLHESNESQWRFFSPSLPVHTGVHSLQRCSCLLGFQPGLFLPWSTSRPSARSTESADILQCFYFSQLLMVPKPTPVSCFSFLCDHLTCSYLLHLLLTEVVRKLA